MTQDQIQRIQAILNPPAGDPLTITWAESDQQIVDQLNAVAANPLPQSTVPKSFSVTDLMGAIQAADAGGAAALAWIESTPMVQMAVADAATLDSDPDARTKIAQLLAGGEAAGKISAAEYAAVLAIVQATEPDPAYQAQCSWASRNLGSAATLDDVAGARANQ